VVVKDDFADYNRKVGLAEEEVVGKLDGAVRSVVEGGSRSSKRADW